MYGINTIFLDLIKNDYSEHLSEESYELDCSLGENPLGMIDNFDFDFNPKDKISSYPHSDKDVCAAIINRFSDIVELENENISITCGSMGGLICLNRLLLKEGKDIIGIAPQFTAVIDDFRMYKANYHPVYLKKEKNFKFSVDDFLKEVEKYEDGYIYIDNPNNPTGQIIDLNDIEKIISLAKDKNSFVCIDEAYGDYMENKNSAINLISKYENLAVFRSISKGLGGAGLRMGYMISNKFITSLFKKVNIPFSTSEFSNCVAIKLLETDWNKKAVDFSKYGKNTLNNIIKNIKIAHTSNDVSISMFYVDNPNIDLEKEFIKGKVRVVSCSGYEGLSQNYIRINLNKDFDKMIKLITEIDAKLESK